MTEHKMVYNNDHVNVWWHCEGDDCTWRSASWSRGVARVSWEADPRHNVLSAVNDDLRTGGGMIEQRLDAIRKRAETDDLFASISDRRELLEHIDQLEVKIARLEEQIEHYGLGPEPDLPAESPGLRVMQDGVIVVSPTLGNG